MGCRNYLVVKKVVAEPEIVDAGSECACGEYWRCWSCRSFSLTFETWHEQLHTNEFLSGFLAD
jgi:hypothetical protein